MRILWRGVGSCQGTGGGVSRLEQLTLGDFMGTKPVYSGELICCSLSQGYHWIKVTSGHTPAEFRDNIDFELDGFENL